MSREPDFKYDDEIYGKFGENDFKNFCVETLNFTFLDVSKDERFQIADIDFLISPSLDLPCYGLDIINVKELIFNRKPLDRTPQIYKFEVKTDTRSFETRNIVVEMISHDFAGCIASSKADFLYYVFVDDSGDEIIKKEVWTINLCKLREYLRVNFFGHEKDENFKDLEQKYGIRTNNYDAHGDKVANFLINIEKLQENGIAKKVF